MSKKVQLNDMELNQVVGGGWKEFWQKVKRLFTRPQILPIWPKPERPIDPVNPIFTK